MTRGKRSSQRRSAAWRARSDRYDTQRVLIQIELTSLIKQARMKPAADRYNEIIPVLCGCLQTSRKPWLQALWRRMKDQYRTNDVVIIARQWQTLMREQSRASLIYQMVSFDTATGYVGQVAYREQHTREWWNPREEYETMTTMARQNMHSCIARVVRDRGFSSHTSSVCLRFRNKF